jgi:RNAse (barnase) inhibitor barstar
MRHEFPWLGSGFIHAVDDDHADALQQDLIRLGFEITVFRGTSMTTSAGFWAEIKTAFGFPEYFGANWDAFNDSFGDLVLPDRTAVLWRDADVCAESDLRLFAEGVAVLTRTADAVGATDAKQIVLILTGHGSSFASPG